MKITYLANVRMPTERAYGIQIINMCRAFAAQDADVLLLFPYRISRAIRQNIFDYYSIERTFKAKRLAVLDFYLPGSLDKLAFHFKNLFSAVSMASYALFENADIIYSRDELPLFLLSFFKKNLWFEAHKFSYARSLFYRRFRSANVRVVAISQALREEFIQAGFSAEHVILAPDAVDLEDFGISVAKEEAREKLGLPTEGNIVMYSGHLFDRKGADILADAAQYLPDASFIFVGGTVREVNEFKKRYGDAGNIIIVGHRPHKEIPLYLQSADVLVLPNSGKEAIVDQFTSPLKLFEYMASRRPIIASDLPILKEVLNETNAVLVEPDRPSLLAERISEVLADKELQARVSGQAFQDVSSHSWGSRARHIMKYFS